MYGEGGDSGWEIKEERMERRSSGFGQGYARQSYPYFLEKCDIDCFVYRLHWRKEAMGKI